VVNPLSSTAECNSLKLGFTTSIPLYINIAIALAWFLVVHRCRVTIVPSLAVELPSRSRRPLPLRRALHHLLFAIAPSIAAHRPCALGPSPPRLRHPSPLRSHRAVPRRRGAVAPLPSRSRQEPSAVSTDNSGHLSHPSQAFCPDGCRIASPHSLIAASPFVPLVRSTVCRVSSLLTPPPPICQHLRLSSRRHLLSRPSWASRPAG
jgi:hypothetical protein